MAQGGMPDVNFSRASKVQPKEQITGLQCLEYYIEQLSSSGRMDISILISGNTGAGKSQMTNALLGQKLAKEGKTLGPETIEVTPYQFSMNNVQITLIDTPGLADGTGNEEEYLQKIKEMGYGPCDVFIFCIEMTSRRLRNDDIKTVDKLTATFGTQVWEHSLVALTFANEVQAPPGEGVTEEEFFDERMRCFKKEVKEVIHKAGVAERVLITVPFVAIGHLGKPNLPGITNWKRAFWIATFKRLEKSAKLPFFLASVDRLNLPTPGDDVRRSERPSRKSLPPRELKDNHLQRQRHRRSFQGFELVDREQDSGYEPDSDLGTECRAKAQTLPVRKSKVLPKSKPTPKNAEKRQDDSTIDIDETTAKEVVLEFLGVAGGEASKLAGEYFHPGAGDACRFVFRWFIDLIKRVFLPKSSKETVHALGEDRVDGKDD